MARPVGYIRIRPNVTPAQLAAIEREMALTGSSQSAVVRRALDAYMAKPKPKRRRS